MAVDRFIATAFPLNTVHGVWKDSENVAVSHVVSSSS